MPFNADKQTLKDIELFSVRAEQSIFKFYDQTITYGGSERMSKYFKFPVSDLEYLENRKAAINYFVEHSNRLELNKRLTDFIEHYRKTRRFPLRNNVIDAFKDGLANKLNPDGDYYVIKQGIFHTLKLLAVVEQFLVDSDFESLPVLLQKEFCRMKEFVDNRYVQALLKDAPKTSNHLTTLTISRMDSLFRVSKKSDFAAFMAAVYEVDVFQTLANLVVNKHCSLAEYSSSPTPVFEVKACFHPFLERPVSNSFSFNTGTGLCFLTGPNMSGKSTFLKTVGLLVYLSHIGFPVPAQKLKISIYQRLFTTINLADNLSQGFSHFYSEVKRVKEMLLYLDHGDQVFVIFDELFKGTNVKDAYDATLMVIESLSQINNSTFFVSSHILEVAETLAQTNSIDFRCFESVLKNSQPKYDYRLKTGISEERTGLQIVKNENIHKLLTHIVEKQ